MSLSIRVWGRLSLAARLAAMASAAVLLLALPLLAHSMRELAGEQQLDLEQAARREASLLASHLAEAVVLRDYTAIEERLERHAAAGSSLEVAYEDSKGYRIRATAPAGELAPPVWFQEFIGLSAATISEPLSVGGTSYGGLHYIQQPVRQQANLWRLLQLRAQRFGIGALLLLGLLVLVTRQALAGLKSLERAARALGAGSTAARAPLPADAPPELRAVIIAFNDMAARLEEAKVALFAEKERLHVTLHSIADGVIVTDAGARVRYVNPAGERLTGWSQADAVGLPLTDIFRIVNEDTRQPVANPAERALREGEVVGLANHTLLLTRDGRELPIEDSAAPIRDAAGEVEGCVLVFVDDSEKRALMRELGWAARHDSLTGLLNRHALTKALQEAVEQVAQGHAASFCFVDLDRFKPINDTLGHAAGDLLLRELAAEMRAVTAPGDVFGRLGGDEFGWIMRDWTGPVALDRAQALLRRVFEYRFRWREETHGVGASIGVTRIQAGDTPAEVLTRADNACYAAKDEGRGRVRLYSQDSVELAQTTDEARWVNRISKGFEEERFTLFRQAIMPLDGSAQPHHYEVLLRLRGEDGQIVLPRVFLPPARHFGLMTVFDRFVVRHLLARLAALPENGGCHALNVSAPSLSDAAFLHFVVEELDSSGVDPARLCFEITETDAVRHMQHAQRFIQTMKGMGCQFALDDFGSGMSSFGYLKHLPVDYLKIDGLFVRDIEHDRADFTLVSAMNQIGHDLGLKTIAECAESEGILERLRSIGADYAQGFAVHTPEPL
jgi:diguanylate cyclase (GGDEF)-like protein/PAS domain S-box-containing protein